MSLLTPDIEAAWVGRSFSFSCDPIPVAEARRFIAASGDDNPAYTLPETGMPVADDTHVPPMLYYAITRPLAGSEDFFADGTVAEHRPEIGTGQTMGGSVEMEWLAPLTLGVQLHGVRTLVALEEKSGRSRDFVLATWVTEYRDDAGQLLVLERYEQILF